MLGDRVRDANINVTILNSVKKPIVARCHFDLNSVPVKEGDYPTEENDIVYSDLIYRVVYKPSYKENKQHVPYMLECDMFEGKYFRFADMEDLKEKAKTDKRIAFLLRWTNLNEGLLIQAKQLLQVRLPICFNTVKYERYLKDIVEKETGVRPEYSMLKNPNISEVEKERYKQYVTVSKVTTMNKKQKMKAEEKLYANY